MIIFSNNLACPLKLALFTPRLHSGAAVLQSQPKEFLCRDEILLGASARPAGQL